MAVPVGACPLGLWLLVGCSSLPCTETGEGRLKIPLSRVEAVAEIRTDGVCEAVVPEGTGCSAGTCIQQDGELRRVVAIRAPSPGTCTVTVTFKDDCPPATLSYRFGGPSNNCCADACFEPLGGTYTIDACREQGT